MAVQVLVTQGTIYCFTSLYLFSLKLMLSSITVELLYFYSPRFPLNDEDRFEKWVHFVGIKDFKPSSSSALCSLHFSEDDYSPVPTEKPMLKKNAVPAILQAPNNVIPKANERRILPRSVEIQVSTKIEWTGNEYFFDGSSEGMYGGNTKYL